MRSHKTLGRRQFMTAAAGTAAAAAGVGALSETASAARFNKYSSVYTTEDLSVRSGPGTGYSRKAVADKYTGGYVLAGPQNSNGYTWWKVRYNADSSGSTVTGWSAGDWLVHSDFSYPATGIVTATYYDSRSSGNHGAVDIANDRYTNVRATRGGTVGTVGWDPDGYGNYIIINHSGGFQTLYGHLYSVLVSEGESVYWDQHIGEMGSTGNSTGPHVHYEIRKNGVRQYVPPSESDEGNKYFERSGVPKVYY
ncbi:M23 family metallopeptidase [Haladaptatus caseinilyticus]|uniref:M23 family metallopeptidase n=1 Tax=Haladaptatus caseinilyticus TaxID=2993314 RepID=UPI0026E5382D|nr:M23 family metallopeptidase [Haladaptatus caseinilyticus]